MSTINSFISRISTTYKDNTDLPNLCLNWLQISGKKNLKKYKFLKQKLTHVTQTLCTCLCSCLYQKVFVYFNFLFLLHYFHTYILSRKFLSPLKLTFNDHHQMMPNLKTHLFSCLEFWYRLCVPFYYI